MMWTSELEGTTLMSALHPEFKGFSLRVSSRCDGGACVMVGHENESIIVGNSTQRNGPYVIYTRAAWSKFLLSVKQGEFDQPA